MRKGILKTLVEFLVAAVILVAWGAMLLAEPRDIGFEGGRGLETPGMSRLNPLRYGFQIFLVATLAGIFLSRRRTLNERLSLGMIIFGMFSLCQPFTIALYRCGFQTLLVGTLAFIIVSHMGYGEKQGIVD